MPKFFIFVLLIMAPLFCYGTESGTPPEVAKYFSDKPPLGKGSFSWYGLKIYDGRLWSKDDKWSYNSSFALTLTYARDIDSEDLINNSITEMRRIDGIDDAKLNTYRRYLEKVFPDVKEGDTITAIYFPHEKVIFFHNGTASGEVADKNFGKDFLNIWLSPKTKAKELQHSVVAKSE